MADVVLEDLVGSRAVVVDALVSAEEPVVAEGVGVGGPAGAPDVHWGRAARGPGHGGGVIHEVVLKQRAPATPADINTAISQIV